MDGATTITSVKTTFTIHDATQLIVGIVAERPGEVIGSLDLLPDVNNVAPLTIALDPTDLPERVEAWNTLDRLIWQDVDAARLTTAQMDALRGWVAGGGRLVITGGTSGPASLSAFPDQLLPYRPTTTTDVAASTLGGLLGEVPDDATDLPALTGELAAGRALATSGDRVVAAELAYGAGNVTVVGFDPTVDWIADSNIGEGLWRRLLPPKASGGPIIGDDSQLVSAASQLPTLVLPPIGGLIALLGAYILLIGPINYLVLKRLDRREWAWVTMPVLIVAFAVGAYGFGSILRGSDLIINEVAIVRGAPGATEGTAQIYLGVFSPTRGSYQVRVPGGALLSSPTSGDFFGGDGSSATLDVLQGDPARIRDLGVGFGSLRTVRAETAVTVPLVEADIRLEDGRMKGTVRNASAETLLKPAVVLGGTVATLDDLAPGATATIDVAIQTGQFGQQLSDKVVGPVFFGDPSQLGGDAARLYARHAIVDQLTYDPTFGGYSGQMPADGPVILAWSDDALLPVEIEGQTPRRTGNILYFLPTDLSVTGTATFRSDLIRSTVVSSDAGFFNKDPYTISLGLGSAEIAYRPIAFEGQLACDGTRDRAQLRRTGGRRGPHPDRAARRDPGAMSGPAHRGMPGRRLRRDAGDRGLRPDRRCLEAPAPPRYRCSLRHRRPGPVRGPGHRHGPDQVPERTERGRRLRPGPLHQRGTPMTEIVRTEGLVKRYDGTLAVAGIDLAVEAGEIFGLVGPERRRQDHDAADPRDAPAARPPAPPRSPATPSPGTPIRCGASSGSCRMCSGSTTT